VALSADTQPVVRKAAWFGGPVGSVFLAVPSYGSLLPRAVLSIEQATRKGSELDVLKSLRDRSLLAFSFNDLWCEALNRQKELRLTHFAMHHADIEAEAGWLDTLVSEQERCGADVLSCVVAIKDTGGDSSTAVHDYENKRMKRLSFADIADLPETFEIADLPGAGKRALCVNTGLWVCNFAKIAAMQERTKPIPLLWFECHDSIGWSEEKQQWEALNLPEDWHFSLQCADKGLKVMATKRIRVVHWGAVGFRNWV
jgi:hypothetical protein